MRTFKSNQKVLNEGLEGKLRQEQTMPDVEEWIKFWSDLWDNPVDHSRNAELLKTVDNAVKGEEQQTFINIVKENVTVHFRKCQIRRY